MNFADKESAVRMRFGFFILLALFADSSVVRAKSFMLGSAMCGVSALDLWVAEVTEIPPPVYDVPLPKECSSIMIAHRPSRGKPAATIIAFNGLEVFLGTKEYLRSWTKDFEASEDLRDVELIVINEKLGKNYVEEAKACLFALNERNRDSQLGVIGYSNGARSAVDFGRALNDLKIRVHFMTILDIRKRAEEGLLPLRDSWVTFPMNVDRGLYITSTGVVDLMRGHPMKSSFAGQADVMRAPGVSHLNLPRDPVVQAALFE